MFSTKHLTLLIIVSNCFYIFICRFDEHPVNCVQLDPGIGKSSQLIARLWKNRRYIIIVVYYQKLDVNSFVINVRRFVFGDQKIVAGANVFIGGDAHGNMVKYTFVACQISVPRCGRISLEGFRVLN